MKFLSLLDVSWSSFEFEELSKLFFYCQVQEGVADLKRDLQVTLQQAKLSVECRDTFGVIWVGVFTESMNLWIHESRGRVWISRANVYKLH